ncbi:MAG TPA: hypothetical protein ENN45_02660 [Bacteroidetes bacterium]|nr:hypothetical protein [Bacteroidota bacterium]
MYLVDRQIEKVALSENVDLTQEQRRIIEKLKNNDRLLIYHGLGSGKTLSALAAGDELNLPIKVVAPASIREQYLREKKKHGINANVDIYSYNKPPLNADNSLLVFDEAHRMGRMESQRSYLPDILTGKKTLLMTATPIRNEPAELIPLLRGLGVDIPRDRKKFNEKFIEEKKISPGFIGMLFGAKPGIRYSIKNKKKLEKMIAGLIDYKPVSVEEFPEKKLENIIVEMGPEQQKIYDYLMSKNRALAYKVRHNLPPSKSESRNLNAFLSGVRQVSNTPAMFTKKEVSDIDEPKITRMVDEIKKKMEGDKNYRGVTYSTYLGSGVKRLAKKLEENGISYSLFTGSLPKAQRDKLIVDYNAGKIRQLLISGAGGEGIDLKGTKLIQIMEPHWNTPVIDQAVGRAVRYKSHKHLPKEEQNVIVQKFFAKPRKRFLRKNETGVDEYLNNLSQKKTDLNERFLNILRSST